MKKVLLACGVSAVTAGSIEVVTSDLSGGSNRVIDNIKGKWSQTLSFLGNDAKLEAEYDRSNRDDFLSEVSLSGKNGDVNYEVRTAFDGDTELKLSTTTKDGTSVEASANTKNGINKVSASRSASVFGQDCDFEASHEVNDNQSKLKMSSVLGHGVKASGTVTVGKGGDRTTNYEVEYDASLGDGRSVSANMNPFEGTGEIEYEDSSTLDATITASMALGGKPKVTMKRSWSF